MPLPKKQLGVFALTMITVAGIYNIRSLPIMAKYGFSSTFFFILAALVFFIPSAMVCAELAASFPKRGGTYAWVNQAFGARSGFLAVWLEWINTVVAFPMNLTFISTTVSYIFMPALAHNKLYMIIMTLSIFWLTTWINLYGVKVSSWVSSIGLIFGTLLPTVLIILLGLIWLFKGLPTHIQFNQTSFFPSITPHSAVLLVSVILGYAGMQVAAFHIHEAKNPQRDFPRAILMASFIIIIASVFGTLAIAIIVPNHSIGIVTGIMQALTVFLSRFHLAWLVPVFACLIIVGSAASLNTWVIAPCKGLHAAVHDGHLPRLLKRTNRHNVPHVILILQALIATLLTCVFLFMPTVASSYWLLTALSAIMTFIMDILLFSAVIRLRYSEPDTPRPYRIPGGLSVVWLVAGAGIIASIAGIILGFMPPSQLKTGSSTVYQSFLIAGLVILCLPAIFIHIRNTKRAAS